MSESALRGCDRPGIAAHKSRCRTPPGRSHPRKADSDMGPPHLKLFPTPNCRADRTGVVPRPTKMCVVVNCGREVLGASATHAGIALCVRNSPRQTFLWVSRPRPFDPHGDLGLGSSLDGGRGGGLRSGLVRHQPEGRGALLEAPPSRHPAAGGHAFRLGGVGSADPPRGTGSYGQIYRPEGKQRQCAGAHCSGDLAKQTRQATAATGTTSTACCRRCWC